MGRSPCCDKLGLKKGPWTPEEDQKLLAYIDEHGHGNWRALPSKAGLQRCGKSCRLRWTNYLRPDIKRGKFSLQEEQTIIQLHALLGNRWSAIATHLPKRTDNEIKNYWNTHLKKRLTKMGIDPVTHKPKNDALVPAAADCGSQQSKNVATLSHMAQWESARLEAEARLVRQSKLRSNASFISPPGHHHVVDLQDQVLDPLSPPPPPQPRCGLDVFKGHNWHTSWPSNDSNHPQNEGIGIGIGVGNGVAGVIGMDSPTSTLSFMGHGGVIEFMRHNSANDTTNHHTNYDQDDHHNNNQGLVKEEGDQWNNNNPPLLLSFNDMSLPIDHNNQGGGTNKEIISGGDDDDDDRDEDEFDHEDENRGFVEGFTNLLLSTTITTTTTTTTTTADATRTSSSSGKSVQDDQGTYNSGSSGTTTSGSDDYDHEDNKLYWNSILNLVNSSPPHSPMF